MKKNILILFTCCSVLSSCVLSETHITTGNPVGKKTGVAVAKTSSKDADFSIQSAAKNGGITKIATVDVIIKQYLFVIKGKTTVTGE